MTKERKWRSQSCAGPNCINPLKQSLYGRPKKYCSLTCARRGRRLERKEQHETLKHRLYSKLKYQEWLGLDRETVSILEEIYNIYGVGAATCATEAVKKECLALALAPQRKAELARIAKRMEGE